LIEITDKGPGIKKEYQKSIFNKFFTLKYKDANTPSGVGLGLAFCKLAVEAHRGFIWVNSPIFLKKNAKGQGSRFYFALPSETKVRLDSIGMEF
jgi:signal transduction histidine kinase